MNFGEYFQTRSDLVKDVLLHASETRPVAGGTRVFVAGMMCLLMAAGLQLWASGALIDPGYFARTTTFLQVGMVGGLWLISIGLFAEYRLARFAVSTSETVKEKTLRQLLRIDGALVRKLATPSAVGD